MLYLDTSLIISALSNEPASGQAQAWLAEQAPGRLLISPWTATEVPSALGIKVRTGQITPAERGAALALFHRQTSQSFTTASVASTHFHVAARYLDQYELGLRASDALHLAVAASEGAQMCTLDRRMATAGPVLGVPTILVSSIGAT